MLDSWFWRWSISRKKTYPVGSWNDLRGERRPLGLDLNWIVYNIMECLILKFW